MTEIPTELQKKTIELVREITPIITAYLDRVKPELLRLGENLLRETKRQKIKTVYLAGKISGDAGYREKFERAEKGLRARGYKVMSPHVLPEGWQWSEYMRITLAMLDVCDGIALLPDWTQSLGASMEATKAKEQGKPVAYINSDGAGEWIL